MTFVVLVSLLPLIVCTAAFSPEFRGASRIFLDTADTGTKVWDEFLPTGIFHGVTTNPTLLERAQEKFTIANLHQRMANKALQMGTSSWGSTAHEMFECGMALSAPARGCSHCDQSTRHQKS
jgi:transaldolase